MRGLREMTKRRGHLVLEALSLCNEESLCAPGRQTYYKPILRTISGSSWSSIRRGEGPGGASVGDGGICWVEAQNGP